MQARADGIMTMRLVEVRYAAHEINVYVFEGVDNALLPPADAGAHVDVHLPDGIVRSYSLIEADRPLTRYEVAVKRDAASRGGSAFLHDRVRVGQVLPVGAPRNNFPLKEGAEHSVLIAGGIGITPILCMARRLRALGRAFELHYACRETHDAAFRDEIEAMAGASLHIDAEAGSVLNLEAIVANAPEGSHFYCCGPTPMLDAYEAATTAVAPDRVHLERFTAAAPVLHEGGYVVVLHETGEEYAVPEGKSILEVLRDAGHDVGFSCEEGICGTCRMRVVEGEPDHRDMVLSDDEKARNAEMMICCSGAKSGRLVLAMD